MKDPRKAIARLCRRHGTSAASRCLLNSGLKSGPLAGTAQTRNTVSQRRLAMPEHKVHLTIETLSGKYEHPFEPGDKLQDVVNATLEYLKIKPAPGDVWELQYNGVTLSLSLTINEAHLPDHAVLTLATKE